MSSTGKAVIIILCAAVIFTSSMFGTIAFFTSTDKVETTFTIGQCKVAVTEAKITGDGVQAVNAEPAERVMSNQVQMTPGSTYAKDPTVTVLAGSESAYVRMIVTINKIAYLDKIYQTITIPDTNTDSGTDKKYTEFNFDHFFNNSVNNEQWKFVGVKPSADGSSRSFEFRYYKTTEAVSVDTYLEPLLTSYKIPGEVVPEENMNGFTIKIVAHAIQSAGFDDTVVDGTVTESAEDKAWKSFEDQIRNTAA